MTNSNIFNSTFKATFILLLHNLIDSDLQKIGNLIIERLIMFYWYKNDYFILRLRRNKNKATANILQHPFAQFELSGQFVKHELQGNFAQSLNSKAN